MTEKRRFFAQLPWTSRFMSASTSFMRAATAFGSVSRLRMPFASRSNASSTALLPSAPGVVASALLRGANAPQGRGARQALRCAPAQGPGRRPRTRAHAARTVQAAAPLQLRCCALWPRAARCACRHRAARSPALCSRCSAAAGASAAQHGTWRRECHATQRLTACASRLRSGSSAHATLRGGKRRCAARRAGAHPQQVTALCRIEQLRLQCSVLGGHGCVR